MSPQATSPLCVVVRSSVPTKANYQDYKQELRVDFWYSCAYCSMAEIEATAIGFDIEHYEPRTRFPNLAHDYLNLMWSCRLCNRQKHEECPNDAMRAAGLRFFRPDWDNPDDHFAIVQITDLRPLTPIGEYTIEVIRLNRLQLKQLRERRHRLYNSAQATHRGLQALRGMRLDRFPPNVRLQIQKLTTELVGQFQEGQAAMDDLLKTLNRSFNLDPEKKDSAKVRRNYLTKIKANFPD